MPCIPEGKRRALCRHLRAPGGSQLTKQRHFCYPAPSAGQHFQRDTKLHSQNKHGHSVAVGVSSIPTCWGLSTAVGQALGQLASMKALDLCVTASLRDTQQKVNHRMAEYFKLEGSLSPPPGSSCTLCVRVVSRCSLSPIQPAEPVPHLLYMEGSLSTTF